MVDAVRLMRSRTNESTIVYVRDLLARCESGEVVEVTCLERLSGGAYQTHGGEIANRLETAGALLEAAMTRLSSGEPS